MALQRMTLLQPKQWKYMRRDRSTESLSKKKLEQLLRENWSKNDKGHISILNSGVESGSLIFCKTNK